MTESLRRADNTFTLHAIGALESLHGIMENNRSQLIRGPFNERLNNCKGPHMISAANVGSARDLISQKKTYKDNCWFSHDVTQFQTLEPLILLRFYFHDV